MGELGERTGCVGRSFVDSAVDWLWLRGLAVLDMSILTGASEAVDLSGRGKSGNYIYRTSRTGFS